MTTHTDTEELIAEVRRWTREDADGAPRNLRRLARAVSDRLESTLAELRQERERVDDLANANADLIIQAGHAEAALSRAEETIEKVRELHEFRGHKSLTDCTCGPMLTPCKTRAILTRYEKTKKEADHDQS